MSRRCAILAVLALTMSAIATEGLAGPGETSPRPSIWVSASDRSVILNKIEEEAWARQLYDTLRSRADAAAPRSFSERRARILAMPLVWSEETGTPPVLRSYSKDASAPVDPAIARQLLWGYPEEPQVEMLKGLQDAIDCGVIYYLTSEEKFAICAADILHLFVTTLNTIAPPTGDPFNNGWLYQQDHLLEARLVGAQLPIIYDLIHPYLLANGNVYDAGTDDVRSFSVAGAQYVFRNYAHLALNRGLYESNWPLLEMNSLVNNILALDDPEERADLIRHVLEEDAAHQPSLRTLNQALPRPGDVWPESLNYSFAASRFLIYAMALLDRNFPELDLGREYPNVLAAYDTYYELQFPNGDYPAFGDSRRKINVDYLNQEIALTLALMNGNTVAESRFKNYLRSSVEADRYDRGVLPNRSYGPEPYSRPLQLLWSVPVLDDADIVDLDPPRHRTRYLPFAGIAVQRNENTSSPLENGLMAVMGGAAYIHGHASGIDLELYGHDAVLGVESGRGVYGSDVHENYYRLFAAHNTVISNGASASAGQWVGLGTDTAEIVAMEPAPGVAGISANYSFATMSFDDEFNLVGPAEHLRTVAVVRLTPTRGYYLDVFRARSEVDDEFHDYVYRNVGDALTLTSNGVGMVMAPDPERYAASSRLVWRHNETFRHPGWHFFEDVASADYAEGPITAEFAAADLEGGPVRMRALIPAGPQLQATRVMAPASSVAEPPYNDRAIPAFVLRRQGEAWSNPFVVIYESDRGDPAVQSVERLMEGQQFRGVRVTSEMDGQKTVQYVFILEPGQTYTHPELAINFVGRFGILTLSADGEVREAYIGEGQSLSYGDFILEAESEATSAYWTAG